MSDSNNSDDAPSDREGDTEERDRLQSVLDPDGLGLIQQILSHDSGVLSAEELAFRNTDLDEGAIEETLQRLAADGIIQALEPEYPQPDHPDVYWAVTEDGIELLKHLGVYSEICVLSAADDALLRTERIKQIENSDHRPKPDWYKSIQS